MACRGIQFRYGRLGLLPARLIRKAVRTYSVVSVVMRVSDMKRPYLLLFVVAIASGAFANPQIQRLWEVAPEASGDQWEVRVDAAGHVFMAGSWYPDGTGQGIAKFSPGGQLLWTRKTRLEGDRNDIHLDSNGNLYLNEGTEIVKYDGSGQELWRLQTGADFVNHETDRIKLMLSESEGCLYVAYPTLDEGNEKGSIANVQRIDCASGASVWLRSDSHPSYGGAAAMQVENGSLYCAYPTATPSHDYHPDHLGIIVKISPDGAIEYKTLLKPLYWTGHSVEMEVHEGTVLFVQTDGSPFYTHLWRLHPSGQIAWVKEFAGDCQTKDIAIDQRTGRFYTIGTHGRDSENRTPLLVRCFTPDGETVWTRDLGDVGSTGLRLEVDRYGRVYAANSRYPKVFDEHLSSHVYALNSDGVLVWQIERSEPLQNMFLDFVLGPEHRLYVAGWQRNKTDAPGQLWMQCWEQAPEGKADTFELATKQPLTVAAPGPMKNDDYAEGGTLVKVSDVKNGKLQLGANGWFSYTPNEGFTGTDSFTYYVWKGMTSETTKVDLVVNIAKLGSLSLRQSSVIGGDTATAVVMLDRQAPRATTVKLASNSSAISVPASVVVQQGHQSALVPLRTSPVSTAANRQLTASYEGVVKVATLSLLPGGLRAAAISPSSITGGNSASGSITLSGPAPAGGRVVSLSSNSSSLAVPGSVTVAAGASTAQFSVSTSPVTTTITRQVVAKLSGVAIPISVAVIPARIRLLELTPSTVKGGQSASAKAWLTGRAAVNMTLLLSSNSSAVGTPSMVTVPPGTDSASFTVTTKPVSATVTRQIQAYHNNVTVTASIILTP